MPNRKYGVEQIVAKLREHEKLQGQGLTFITFHSGTSSTDSLAASSRSIEMQGTMSLGGRNA